MSYDPSGNFTISTLIIIGLIGVGVVVGATTAGVVAYNNDVRGWALAGCILGGGLIGGAIGGLIGYLAAPAIAGMLASSGSIGGMALAGVFGSTGGVIAISSLGQLALAGALGLTVVGTVGATYMFAKGNGPRMGHNQYENKQFHQLCNKHHLTKEEERMLHDYISHQNYSYHEIERIIFELFGK